MLGVSFVEFFAIGKGLERGVGVVEEAVARGMWGKGTEGAEARGESGAWGGPPTPQPPSRREGESDGGKTEGGAQVG